MPNYTLLTVDGEDLGTVTLGRPDWPAGSILYRGNAPNLRVVRIVEAADTGHLDVLVVEVEAPDHDAHSLAGIERA